MANCWIDLVSGSDANDGLTAATPKQHLSAIPASAAGYTVYVKKTHGAWSTLTSLGSGTVTVGTKSIGFSGAPSVSAGDIVHGDGLMGVNVTSSVSGNNIIPTTIFNDDTGTYTFRKATPVDLSAWSSAQLTIAANLSGNQVGRTTFLFGCDDTGAQTGLTIIKSIALYFNGSRITFSNNFIHVPTGTTSFVLGSANAVCSHNFNLINLFGNIIPSYGFADVVFNKGQISVGTYVTTAYFTNMVFVDCYLSVADSSTALFNVNIGVKVIRGRFNSNIMLGSSLIQPPLGTSIINAKYIGASNATNFPTSTNIGQVTVYDTNNNQVAKAYVASQAIGVDQMIFTRCNIDGTTGNGWQNSGLNECQIVAIGTVLQQKVSDSNFTIPADAPDIGVLFFNQSANNSIVPRASSGLSRYNPSVYLLRQPLQLFVKAGTWSFYTKVLSQLALNGDGFWMEVHDGINTVLASTNTSLNAAPNSSTWQTISTGQFTLATDSIIYIDFFSAFYHASNKIGFCTLKISPDNGTTLIPLQQFWREGEMWFRWLDLAPTASTLTYGSTATQNGALVTGTQNIAAAADVRRNVATGTTVGNIDLAPASKIATGIGNGSNGTEIIGTRDDALTTDVRYNATYAAGEKKGTAHINSPNDVRAGVAVDATTGNLSLTTAGNISAGIGIGSHGIEIVGTRTDAPIDKVEVGTEYGNPLSPFVGTKVIPEENIGAILMPYGNILPR